MHDLGLEFDEEHNGEVRFQISLFLKKLQAFTCSMLNVGPLLCQASVQLIHPIVHNPDKNRLHR